MFEKLAQLVNERLSRVDGALFRVHTDREEIVRVYLSAFPPGTNEIFRVNTEHDCSCCKHFIRNLGSTVYVNSEGEFDTIWNVFDKLDDHYGIVAKAMHEFLLSRAITGPFLTREQSFGKRTTYSEDRAWNHFYGNTPSGSRSESPSENEGRWKEMKEFLRRSVSLIKPEAIDTVLSLIEENQIYRGQEAKHAVLGFKKLLQKYELAKDKNVFLWQEATTASSFKNTSIGTLVVDLSSGMDESDALRSYHVKVAPSNYQRPTAVVSQRMIMMAKDTIERLGYMHSLERRLATMNDLTVNDIIWTGNSMVAIHEDRLTAMFDKLSSTEAGDLSRASPISFDGFVSKLQKTEKLEVLVEYDNTGNFMTMTAAKHQDSSPMFKWGNHLAWSYTGNVADSIKVRVQKAGGNITSALRVSLAWEDLNDLDLHADIPRGEHIYYCNKRGILDVDMNVGNPVRNAVENMAFQLHQLKDGIMGFYVNNFREREAHNHGFTIEMEHKGQIRRFRYPRRIKQSEHIDALKLRVSMGNVEVLGHYNLEAGAIGKASGQHKWGVEIGTFIPVSLVLHSPNHWTDEVGNQHCFLISPNVKVEEDMRGFYNEYLNNDLKSHRKAFEIIGNKLTIPPSTDSNQLSGLGFSSTNRAEFHVRMDGQVFKVHI